MKALCAFVVFFAMLGCSLPPAHLAVTDEQWHAKPSAPATQPAVERARRFFESGSFEAACTELSDVFRADRWNAEANALYQDSLFAMGKSAFVLAEYSMLYLQDRRNGDALWFYMRPMLKIRGVSAWGDATDEESNGLSDAEYEELRLIRIAMKDETFTGPELQAAIAFLRDLAKAQPGNGYRKYLLVTLLIKYDGWAALDELVDAFVRRLTGVHLINAFAWFAYPLMHEVCIKLAGEPEDAPYNLPRGRRGWHEISLHLFRILDLTKPNPEYRARIAEINDSGQRATFSLEDLSAR